MQSYRRKCRKFRFVNSAPAEQGARTAAGVFASNVRHLFLHRLSGVLEPRRRFTLTCGEFFAEMQRGVALCGARESAAHAAGAKRKGHLRFPFLFGLLPFPCFLIWRRLPICDRCEKEYGRGFFLCCGRTTFGVRPLEQPVRSVRYITATHVISSKQARHDSAAQLVSLEFTDGTCELGVWYNLSS